MLIFQLNANRKKIHLVFLMDQKNRLIHIILKKIDNLFKVQVSTVLKQVKDKVGLLEDIIIIKEKKIMMKIMTITMIKVLCTLLKKEFLLMKLNLINKLRKNQMKFLEEEKIQ